MTEPAPLTGSTFLNVAIPIVLLTIVTIGLHILMGGRGWSAHRTGLWPLIVGEDRRLSTSKVQLMLWTFAIVLALLLLLFFGKDFSALELQPEYLLLLGSPAAAVLLAKTFTASKVSNGAVENTEAPAPSVTDVVTDDEGNTDLFDFQYFLFNLVLLVWFAVEMSRTLSDPSRLADGAYFLPPLPLTLVGLTSASAAGYVVKKGLETERPSLLAAYPSVAAPHDEILLTGRNLRITTATPAAGAGPEHVTFGGRTAEVVQPLRANPQGFDEINVRVPADAQPDQQAAVQFTRVDGAVSESLGFGIVAGGPQILSVNPDRIVLREEADPAGRQRITILGTGFGDYETDDNPPSNRVSLGGVPLEASEDNWATERIWALAPTLADVKNASLNVPGRTELVVIDRYGRRSAPAAVELVEVAN